jgi:hypothetical protein
MSSKTVLKSNTSTSNKSKKVKATNVEETNVEETNVEETNVEENNVEETNVEETNVEVMNEDMGIETDENKNSESGNDTTSDKSSDQSESLTKESFLNDLNELNNLLLHMNKYNIKKFIFMKDELKQCDQTYTKIGSNKEKLNTKMLHINRDVKQSKKIIEKKVDDNGNEIKKDTSNHAVNKKKETFNEVLEFMDLPENTHVSRTDVHRAFIDFIKIEKEKSDSDIYYDNTKKTFKIIGKMKKLFDFIRNEKIKRGKMSEDEELPDFIENKDIMKYTSYCFPIAEKK